MINDESENKFSTTYTILEAYFDRFTSNTIDRIIESYSENGSYKRGYHDAAFFIYASNNREDFEEIKKPFLSKESGVEESDGFEELQALHDISRNKSREGDLFDDCARLLSPDLQAELEPIISAFFKNKINQYLQEKLPVQYQEISENFDLEHEKILESSSEGGSKKEAESDTSSDTEVGSKRGLSKFEEQGKNPATQPQSKIATALKQTSTQVAHE